MAEPSVSLGVEVTLDAANHGGTEPFTYTWRRNGQELAGAEVVGPRLNLGAVEMGNAARVDQLRVEWPSGAVQEYRDVHVNQHLVIKEPPRLVPTSRCEFEVQCWPGMHFTVEASADLATWMPVGSVRHGKGTATFSDAVGAHGACRFYRVVED